jgi:hypothetical protein
VTTPAPVIVPIFATPFAVAPLASAAELNARLVPLLLSRATETQRDPAAPHDRLCFRSREDLFDWDVEPIGELRREMLGAVCAAVLAATSYSEAEFQALRVQARARFAIVRPNGCLPAATAPLSSWQALYCVGAPPPAPDRADSATLRLYGIRNGTMFLDAANSRLRAPFGESHQVWRPVAGQIAIFPSSILHEVALNRAAADLILVLARVRFASASQAASAPW